MPVSMTSGISIPERMLRECWISPLCQLPFCMPRFIEQHGPTYAPLSSQNNDEDFENEEESLAHSSHLSGSKSYRFRIRHIREIAFFVAVSLLLAALVVHRIITTSEGDGAWTREQLVSNPLTPQTTSLNDFFPIDFRSSFPSKITRVSIGERSNIYGLSARVDIGLEVSAMVTSRPTFSI
jgi:hypothetical protein